MRRGTKQWVRKLIILFKTGFIEEVNYPDSLANVVLVKKSNEK